MDSTTFDSYLNDRYRKQIAWYDRRAQRNQLWYRALKVYVLFAAASIAALAAIDVPTESLAALGASVAAVEGLSGIFKFHETWLNYRTTAETLKKEIHFYQSRTGEYIGVEDPEALFVQRVETIISRENSLWLVATREKPAQAPKPI